MDGSGHYYIPIFDAPSGSELNSDVAAAYFPFADLANDRTPCWWLAEYGLTDGGNRLFVRLRVEHTAP